MKKKLNLNELRIKSFVTHVDENKVETVKGGAAPPNTDAPIGDRPKSLSHCGIYTDIEDCAPTGGESVLNVCHTVYYYC